jgi:hypothetical protein
MVLTLPHHVAMYEIYKALPLAVSVEKAAQLLGISTRLAWTLVGSGVIPSKRLRRRVLVPVAGLEQLLRGEEVNVR